MVIPQEIQDKLKAACDFQIEIEIEGFNELGDPFETKGKIAISDNNEPFVHETYVCLDFAQDAAQKEGKASSPWIAPFFSVSDKEAEGYYHDSYKLIIRTIRLPNGKVLYENPDADRYLRESKYRLEGYRQYAQKEGFGWVEEPPFRVAGCDGLEPCVVAEELMSLLGRPIVLDGQAGVLTELPRLGNPASLHVQIMSGPVCGSMSVDAFDSTCSTLQVLDLEKGELGPVISQKEFRKKNIKGSNKRQKRSIWNKTKDKIQPTQPGDHQ